MIFILLLRRKVYPVAHETEGIRKEIVGNGERDGHVAVEGVDPGQGSHAVAACPSLLRICVVETVRSHLSHQRKWPTVSPRFAESRAYCKWGHRYIHYNNCNKDRLWLTTPVALLHTWLSESWTVLWDSESSFVFLWRRILIVCKFSQDLLLWSGYVLQSWRHPWKQDFQPNGLPGQIW